MRLREYDFRRRIVSHSNNLKKVEVNQLNAVLAEIGERAFSFTLLHSKTNQTGVQRADSEKPILDEAADALDAWIRQAGIAEGPIFRRVRRGEKVGEPLAPAAVRTIVLERATLAGLPPDFAAHSLRSGFVTEAARQNVPLGEAMALTGHASAASLIGYFRAAQSMQNRGAKLIQGRDLESEPSSL